MSVSQQIQKPVNFAPSRDIHEHLRISRYGDFVLTPAVRPSLDLQIIPSEGYRREVFVDPKTRVRVPMLVASVSMERLFDTFLDLLTPLHDEVDCVIETHHDRRRSHDKSHEVIREQIDLPVLKSYFHDFQDLLLEDGCLAVSVVDPKKPCEIQFDDHKLLVVYAADLEPFCDTLNDLGISQQNDMNLISEAEHLHSTLPEYAEQADRLIMQLGAR